MKGVLIIAILTFLTSHSFAQFNRNSKSVIIPDSTITDGDALESKKSAKMKPPEFPGGFPKLMRYIDRKVRYPKDAKQNNINGHVHVQFVVDKEGNVKKESVKVIRPLFDSCDKEAVRVIKSCPQWIPAVNLATNEKVEVQFVIPIKFSH